MGERPGPELSGGTEEIEREVLARLAPDEASVVRLEGARQRLIERAEAEAKSRAIPVTRCLVAGSAARGTYLKDRLDIDLFLLFPPTTPRADLERMGMALAQAVLPDGETRYAEHPYLRGTFEGFQVDAVPGFAVDDPSRPLSAVDRTPFHQAYLTARHTAETVAQVRLTKQFLLSLGVYGSEARTGGFSGYLVELLVLRFGALRKLLAAAQEWRLPVRLESTPGAKPTVPDDVALIFDDPVDPGRNVATALSRRNLALFVLASRAYLNHPTPAWFERRPTSAPTRQASLECVADRGTHVAVLWLPRPKVVDDILYPQLRKAERAVADESTRLGFTVLGTASAPGPDRVVVVVEVEHAEVPAVRLQDGPPAGIDRVGSFLEKWTQPGAPVLQGPYVALDGKLAVETRRPERRLEPLLRDAVDRLPLGRDLKPTAGSTVVLTALSSEPDDATLDQALGDLLEKRLPWLPPSA